MATLEEYKKALGLAEKAGDGEAVAALKAGIAEIEGTQDGPGIMQSFLGGASKAVGNLGVAPLYNFGIEDSERLAGKRRKSYEERFVGPEPTTREGRVAASAGNMAANTLLMLAPIAKGAQYATKVPQALSGLGPVAYGVAQQLAGVSPGILGAEFAGGAGAGAGGQLVREEGGGPLAQFGGEMAGGVAPGLMRAINPMTYAPRVYRWGKQQLSPLWDPNASNAVVTERVGSLAVDPEQAARNIQAAAGSPLTSAQKSGDPRLMQLEKAAARDDEAFARWKAKRDAASGEQVREAIAKAPGEGDTQGIFRELRQDVRRRIENAGALRQQKAAAAEGEAEARIGGIERGAEAEAERVRMETGRAVTEARQAATGRAAARAARAEESVAKIRDAEMAAKDSADEAITAMGPDITEEAAARIYRSARNEAEDLAHNEVRAAWGRVNQGLPVDMGGVIGAYKKLVADTPKALKDHIPRKLGMFLDPANKETFLGDVTNVKEAHGLYSAMLDAAREANRHGDRDTRRIALQMAAPIREALLAADVEDDAFNAARRATAEYHDRFTKGDVADLGIDEKTGGLKVSPEETLRDVMGATGGPAAVTGVESALKAVPSAAPTLEQYWRNQFQRKVNATGKYNLGAARAFLANNKELLDRFPAIRGDIERANAAVEQHLTAVKEGRIMSRDIEAGRKQADAADLAEMRAQIAVAEARGKGAEREIAAASRGAVREAERAAAAKMMEASRLEAQRVDRYQNTAKSYTAKALKVAPDKILDTVLKADNPFNAARHFKRLAGGNKTAQEGLDTAYLQSLLQKSVKGYAADGEPVYGGRELYNLMNDPKMRGVLEAQLPRKKLENLAFFTDQLMKLEAGEGASPLEGPLIEKGVTSWVSRLARVGAVRLLSKANAFGGGAGPSMQSAAMVSNQVRDWLNNVDKPTTMLLDVLQNDKKLAKALLDYRPPPIAPKRNWFNLRVPAWVFSSLGETEGEIMEEESE